MHVLYIHFMAVWYYAKKKRQRRRILCVLHGIQKKRMRTNLITVKKLMVIHYVLRKVWHKMKTIYYENIVYMCTEDIRE